MAFRPHGYGMTAELNRKKNAKYEPGLAAEAKTWIESLLGETVFDGCGTSPEEMQSVLKDGVVLLRLANALGADFKKINHSKMAFKMMENIGNFLDFCREDMEVPTNDLFQTVDLYEMQNMAMVINGIHALGRRAYSSGKTSYQLGPKESTANKREFSEEKLQAGRNVIGLQAGSNKGASQKGDHYGRPRQIAGHDAYN